MNQTPKVQFHNLIPVPSLKNRKDLKLFLTKLAKKEGRPLKSLNIILCSDEYLLSMNKQFLQHDYYTDIITFDLSEGNDIEGELYISVDRVKENALSFSSTLQQELHRVIFHGLLHLCGYKDKSPKHIKEMRAAEQRALSAYFK